MKEIRQNDLHNAMKEEILPALSACRTEKKVQNGKTSLFSIFYKPQSPHGTVVMVHGFSEQAEKYRELIYCFLQNGLAVLIYDQRGHGRSDRTAPLSVTHIEKFSFYVADLEALLAAYEKELPRPLFLFAHSMGGAVSALYMEKHPAYFQKAVLSSPMIAPCHGNIPLFFCRVLCLGAKLCGKGKKKLFSAKKDYANEKFEDSHSLSHERFEEFAAVKRQAPEMLGAPPSYTWTYNSLGVTKKILRRNAPEKVQTPVLLFSAEYDSLVQAAPQKEFAARVAHGVFRSLPAKHEIYGADDKVFFPYLNEILSFFS